MGKRFLHNRAAVITVAVVLLIALMGLLAPVLAPHDPYATDILNKFAPYSLEYPLGTDHLGRCVLSRLIYGIRPTLGLALLTMLGTIALGAALGIMAGYFRGVVEEVIMRVVDVMLSFPSQIMVFAVVGLLGINVQNVIIANVFIKWAWYARMIRTGVMQYRERNFIQFSRCVGMLSGSSCSAICCPPSPPTWRCWPPWMWAGPLSTSPPCPFWAWASRRPRRSGAPCSTRPKRF